MIDREKQLYDWANPKQCIGEGFIHFEFGICPPTGDTTGDTSSVTVDLNNQWVASTKKLDGYLVYMSNSNKGIDNGYASMKIKFKGKPDFKIWINSYAEAIYDYTIAFNMDVDYPTSNPASNPSFDSTGVKADTSDFQKDPSGGIQNFKEVDYPNDGGEHFVVVTYSKDDSGNEKDDRGYVAIQLTPLSTSWVLSSTEFVKENDKYYQRINEVGTFEGGVTATTGNFKSGNELTPTYIQSTDANDYIVIGTGKYYKKYAYVTPVDTAINTGDYIQGDYIGEYKPSMKVTYTDGTEKTYYELTTITEFNVSTYNAKNIVIYDGVARISRDVFRYAESLETVTIENSANKIECYINSQGEAHYNTAKLYVPSNLLADYQADTNWTGAFPGGIYAIEDTTGTTTGSTTGDTGTTTGSTTGSTTGDTGTTSEICKTVVTYTDGTTKEFSINGEIRKSDIDNISAATKVDIGNCVTIIDNACFEYCSGLTSVSIPKSVTIIRPYAFYKCSGLTSISIPKDVTYISQYAFSDCSRISTVTIEKSTSILAYTTDAFWNISSTAKLYVPKIVLWDYMSDILWTTAFKGGIYAIE